MIENTSKRAVIYCRVSTKEQAEEGNSLVTQERVCKEYAVKNGYEIVQVFIEQGESAKTINRTEFNKLLKFCVDRKNNIQAVIAYKIDRISRNVGDYSQIRLTLKRYKVEIKSTSENIEDTPVGRFMENMLANVSEFDNAIRTERSVNGSKEAVREGRHIGLAPYGYTNMRVEGKRGKSNIYPNDKRIFVEKAFAMVAKNDVSVQEVRLTLAKEGMINATGKPFGKSQFYRLLQNEVYAGWINKFKERHKGIYEPLISETEFKVVQYVLKRRAHKGFIYNLENEDFPLRRFVFNNEGNKLTGYWAKGRRKKYPYYRFTGTKSKEFRKEEIEQSFIKFLGKYKFNDEYISQLKKSLASAYKNGTSKSRTTKNGLKLKIDELKERQGLLIQKNIKGVLPDSILKEQLDIIELDLQKLYSEHSSINDESILEEDWNKAIEYLKNPEKIWAEGNLKLRKRLQWFEFPKGVFYDGKIFRTAEVASIFKAKNDFLQQKSHSVHRTRHSSNKPILPKHQEYTRQIKELSNILTFRDIPP